MSRVNRKEEIGITNIMYHHISVKNSEKLLVERLLLMTARD